MSLPSQRTTILIASLILVVILAGFGILCSRYGTRIADPVSRINLEALRKGPEFIYIGGSSFKTVGSEPVFADDCIGCGEIGDVSVYRNREDNRDLTQYTVDAQCGEKNFRLVEKVEQVSDLGTKIGVRCLVADKKWAHIFWTEGNEFWFINAPNLEIAKEFEASAVYRLWKSNEMTRSQ